MKQGLNGPDEHFIGSDPHRLSGPGICSNALRVMGDG